MDYEEKIKTINELLTQKKDINNKISQQKDAIIDAIDIALYKQLPADIDIDNEISIRVNDASIDICFYRDNCCVTTKIISVLENILGEGEINYYDSELIVNFEYWGDKMINICCGKEHLTEKAVKSYVEQFKDIEIERIIEVMYNIGYEDGYDDCLMEGYEEEEEEW